jgi:hypothetical protein
MRELRAQTSSKGLSHDFDDWRRVSGWTRAIWRKGERIKRYDVSRPLVRRVRGQFSGPFKQNFSRFGQGFTLSERPFALYKSTFTLSEQGFALYQSSFTVSEQSFTLYQ